jgi:hypothetical protein
MSLVMIAALLALSASLSIAHGSKTWETDSQSAYMPRQGHPTGAAKAAAVGAGLQTRQTTQQEGPGDSEPRYAAYHVSHVSVDTYVQLVYGPQMPPNSDGDSNFGCWRVLGPAVFAAWNDSSRPPWACLMAS